MAVSWNRTRVSKTTRSSGIFVDPWISIHAIFFLLFHLRSSKLSISKVREMWLLFFFSTASFGLEERIYRDESVRFFSIRVNVK